MIGVRNTWAIAQRELLAIFVSPIAYVMLFVALLINGFSFYLLASFFSAQSSMSANASPIQSFFGGTTLFYIPLLLLTPIATMRLLAEETRSGTLETLLTAPVTEMQVVLGKYLAGLALFFALWGPVLLYVVVSAQYGAVDWGVIASSFLGLVGIGAHYVAVGLLMSALARSQIVAAALTFLVLGLLFIAGFGEFVFEDESRRQLFAYVNLWTHMESFSKGIVDTRHLAYYASVSVLCIFFAVRTVEARRWNG